MVREQAAKAGRDEPNRADWRGLSIVHIADTGGRAIGDCTNELQDVCLPQSSTTCCCEHVLAPV